MAKKGRLTYQITVPTGGWDTTVGAGTATIPAGTYHIVEFLAEVATQFATAGSTTCTVTASIGENGTGIATITFGSAKAISWVDTEVRDILGFYADRVSATSHVSPRSVRGVWLPTCEWFTVNGGDGTTWRGNRESDYRFVSNMAGHVWAIAGQNRVVLDPLRWTAIKRERIWISNETTANQSLERFWLDTIAGEASWASPGGPLRWYPDAGDDDFYGTYRPLGWEDFAPGHVKEGFVGLWTVTLPPLVQVPGTEDTGIGPAPEAGFTFSVEELDVTFTDTSTDDGSIVMWSWDFGDSNGSNEQNPTHTYAAEGVYTVELTVTDNTGLTDTYSTDVYVPTDGPGFWYAPTATAHFAPLGVTALDYTWGCQDASGDLTDVLGGSDLVKVGAGSAVYQQAVTGWNRLGAGTSADNTAVGFRLAGGTGPNPATQSVAWVGIFQVYTLPAAVRFFFYGGNTVPQLNFRLQTNGRIQVNCSGNINTGTYNYVDGNSHYFALVYNRTSGVAELLTDQERLIPTYEADVVDSNKGAGDVGGGSVTAHVLFQYIGAAQGANAERDWKAYLQAMGVAVPY